MQKIGQISSSWARIAAFGLIVAAILGCNHESSGQISAQKLAEAMLLGNLLPPESPSAIDGDIYLPYYNPVDLPQLELTPLEMPSENAAAEIRLQDVPLGIY